MQRREFFKASAVAGSAAALESCGNPEHQLIRFIPEEDLIPGVATWKPSLCTMCPAGCGLLVRVMEGDAEVERNGKLGLMKMGLAKKLEGNPNHPVNRGKLCARGQAGLQITYHPDRLRSPLKRRGARGANNFQEVSWDDALKELATQLSALRSAGQGSLAFLTRPLQGQRRVTIDRFLKAFGSGPAVEFEFLEQSVLRHANELSFGHRQLPTLDIARANYIISFGAEFLGTWNSPVAQSIGYGEMRQGRAGQRGKFVQVEPRLSQTGANADEWIAARPGSEGVLALGLAHVILAEKLGAPEKAGRAGALIEGWSQALGDFAPERVEKTTGVRAATMRRLARELAGNQPSLAIIGGAPLAQTNGLFSALAVNALNALLGNTERPGGMLFTPQPKLSSAFTATAAPSSGFNAVQQLVHEILSAGPRSPKLVMVFEANPVFALPPAVQMREALQKVPYVVSFGSFVDETSAFADLILPDHSPLESWVDGAPESGTAEMIAAVAAPAVLPLHNTRAMPDVLLDLAHRLGGDVAAALPWKSYQDQVHAAFDDLRTSSGVALSGSASDFWNKALQQGGWKFEKQNVKTAAHASAASAPGQGSSRPQLKTEAEFDGPEAEFPFHFLPYPSPMMYDGSAAHLPWMQETPDPLSTAMWSTWVEMNPQSAERLHFRHGDLVEVASRHGALRAPVVVTPAIAPDIIAMPIGQGHENYGRYASGRGANPIAILAPMTEGSTGALAWAATRVKVTRVGEGKLVLFATRMQEQPAEIERR